MGVKDLEKFLPVVLINKNYVITSLNETGKMMLGDVVGKKCFQVLYNLDKPCQEYEIKCPIVTGEENIDTVTLDFEIYLRAYGRLPVGGIFWESMINMTNVNILRSGVFDSLTDLYSRSFLTGVLEKFLFMWQRYRDVFSVLFIDIDNLKRVNDEFGHLSGDEALKKIGQCIKLYLRKSDFGIRYGGDEFLVLLPKTRLDKAVFVAQRIHQCVESIPFVTELSISVGVTEVREEDKKPEDIIKRADQALYYAKEKRKGSIAVARSGEEFYLVD
jgi:diguanylate cyclase (GGDEF)-like protein